MLVEALRSGDYKQTTGKLCEIQDDEVCFCGLGVICDLFLKHNPNTKLKWEGGYDFEMDIGDKTGSLPMEIEIWAGVNRAEAGKIVGKNDCMKMNFIQLADYIEEHL